MAGTHRHLPRRDFFVGSHDELSEQMTLASLQEAMIKIYHRVGDALSDAPFTPAGEFERMHYLRNNVMFAVHDATLRKRYCGRQAQ
jgi:hypothetical protein